ncbi:hypothetical protein GHT06_017018 [Daphnia sinensis]|uniref:Peptidase A2 domain-containing protein n=1 Tax=Daphnia sinensis TaxID=1820382 RepID=A0AAD5L6Z9_9CRUS|nr:hypothetical protein GHT06_017018 [Daphnia sinensis]
MPATRPITPNYINKITNEKFKGLLDSGASRSLIKTDVFNRLKEGVMKFTADFPVDLYGVENTRLVTRGLVTLQVQVLGDNLLQDFIVVDSISEECILGLEALYEHNQTNLETLVAREKITIKPFSATVVESEGNGAKLPPNLAGVRVDPFVNKSSEEATFTIALVNETNKPISLPRYEIIGT